MSGEADIKPPSPTGPQINFNLICFLTVCVWFDYRRPPFEKFQQIQRGIESGWLPTRLFVDAYRRMIGHRNDHVTRRFAHIETIRGVLVESTIR